MSAPPPSCQILGDPDLYGLGVRLAVYAQALTYLCATTYSKSPRMILEIPCLLLSIAVNSVLVLRAFQRRLRPFDTMLALFTAGTLGAATPLGENTERERRGRTMEGKIVTWLQTGCLVLQLGFGLWAVMNDMKVNISHNVDNCPVWIYVFSKQRNSGWALNVWKGVYGFSAVFLTLGWMWRRRVVRNTVRAAWKWIGSWVLKPKVFNPKAGCTETPSEAARLSTPLNTITVPPLASLRLDLEAQKPRLTPKKEQLGNLNKVPTQQLPAKQSSPRPETFGLIAGLFWLVFFNVLGGEFMIYWNHVQGVNSLDSSGQILSLLCGTFTLAQFIWAVSGLSLGPKSRSVCMERNSFL